MCIESKTFSLATLGCRLNQYETECIREALLHEGLREASEGEASDLYVINTCAVTAESERKSRQLLRRALRHKEEDPNVLICVCGCASQSEWNRAPSDSVFSAADVICGNTQKSALATLLRRLVNTPAQERKPQDLREDISRVRDYEALRLADSRNARAFVKIEDGCDSFCAYCLVPFVRGRVRSRPTYEILSEVRRLAAAGFHEVVLTGIETGAYGKDLAGGEDLPSLAKKISAVQGIERIRFGSLKPTLFTRDFCTRLCAVPKVMPHFHLSLQSGSDRVLSAMGRGYGRKEEESAIDEIVRAFDDVALSADFICGFPGENDEDFAQTVSLLEYAHLLHAHIFPFSPRRGTRAEKLGDTVPPEVKNARCRTLLDVARTSSEMFAKARTGREYRVLCERVRDSFAFGYTENFIYTKTKVPAGTTLPVGTVFSAVLDEETSFSVETMTCLAHFAQKVDNFEKKL